MSLNALRIKNLRCLTDTGSVPLKPITVLVGRNSSGKSTFLRAFPLLRQSVETATEGPLLWYEPRYVDFGSIQEAINDRAADRSITFEFSLTLPRIEGTLKDTAFDVAVTLIEGKPPRGTSIRSYEIRFEGSTARISLDPDGRVTSFTVNAQSVADSEPLWLRGAAFLLPSIGPESDGEPVYHPVTGARGFSSRSSEWRDTLRYLLTENDTAGFRDVAVASLLTIADAEIAHFMSRIAYLAPLRATAERSYRIQDLFVGEVDPRGENLAMFLRSLTQAEFESFSSFTRTHLDFEPAIQTEGLHVEVRVQEAGARRHINLVDVGFGYSQVLPLAAIVWSTCCRKPGSGRKPTSLLAIEQPELHLHPAYQAKLARMVAGALLESRKAGQEVRLLVETHSEALVNGLGELVHKKQLDAADVQLVVFEQDDETRQTSVRLAHFNESGALQNWPYGFFAPALHE